MRRWVALLLVLTLAGCTTERVGGTPSRPSTGSSTGSPTGSSPPAGGPVDLQVPLDLAPVVPAGAAAPSPSVLPDPDGLPLTLSLPLVKVERLEDARVEFQENAGSWAVVLTLTAVDAQVFGDWTASHVGERLAVVADGKVIFAPQISAAITTGEVFISARYTQAEAGDLLNQLTGR